MRTIDINGKWKSKDGKILIEFINPDYYLTYYGMSASGSYATTEDKNHNIIKIELGGQPFGLYIFMVLSPDGNHVVFEVKHEMKKEPQNAN